MIDTASSPPKSDGVTTAPTILQSPSPNAWHGLPLLLGSLYAVVFADAVQIAAGLAEIDPSPPGNVLPLIAAMIALGVAAIPLLKARRRLGLVLGTACCATSMIGMAPHKLFLEDGAAIAPMALVGFAFEVVFIAAAVRVWRATA